VGSNGWQEYRSLFGLSGLRQRLRILKGAYLNHRFERRSPLPPLSRDIYEMVMGEEVVFPPRSLMLQEAGQTFESLYFLLSLAKALETKVAFEIGTYMGLTSWSLARNLPGATIHTLDIPPDKSPALELEASDSHRSPREGLVYDSLPHDATVVQHWADSATFDFSALSDACDLVLVDGAHSRQYVESDTRHAYEIAGARSAIVWDDYWRFSPGVTGFLNDLARSEQIFRVPETRLVVHLSEDARRDLTGS
jgi:hypothetical protein